MIKDSKTSPLLLCYSGSCYHGVPRDLLVQERDVEALDAGLILHLLEVHSGHIAGIVYPQLLAFRVEGDKEIGGVVGGAFTEKDVSIIYGEFECLRDEETVSSGVTFDFDGYGSEIFRYDTNLHFCLVWFVFCYLVSSFEYYSPFSGEEIV